MQPRFPDRFVPSIFDFDNATDADPIDCRRPIVPRALDPGIDLFLSSAPPSLGIFGAPKDALALCLAAATTRKSGQTKQSYDNCAMEACRQIINHAFFAKGRSVSEDALRDYCVRNHLSDAGGGTNSEQQLKILALYGVNARVVTQTLPLVQASAMLGKGMLVGVDAAKWFVGNGPGMHGVLVTGVVKDASGKVTAYYINDTGDGNCGEVVPAARFENAFVSGGTGVLTDDIIWRNSSDLQGK